MRLPALPATAPAPGKRQPADTRSPPAAKGPSFRLPRLSPEGAHGNLISHVLDDASLTPLGAFNTIRDDVVQLLAKPEDPILDRVLNVLAELGDQLSRSSRSDLAVTDDQAQKLLLAMNGISALLASGTSEPIAGPPSPRPGLEENL
jgi:hypothetical protein